MCAALNSAISADNADEIKNLKEDLQKAFYDLSAKVYQQAAPNGAAGAQGIDPSQFANMGGAANAGAQGGNDDGVVDADFTEV